MVSSVVWKAVLLAAAVHCVAGDAQCAYPCPLNYAPICGSDGVTYPNECALTSEKKCKNSDLRMAYEGECGSAEKCLPRMKTGACTREYMPVCGSDGKTYGNMCTFCYARYQLRDQGKVLSIRRSGQCAEPRVVDMGECPESSKHGICTLEYRPVCANDGLTYPTKCAMCATMYRKQKEGENIHLHVVHEGQCKKSSVAAEIECYPREKAGVCTREYNPVCGNNGKTYANKCTFCYAMAQAEDQQLTIAHHGSCETEKRATAPRPPTCYPRMKYGACTRELRPVCGTNGQTYANECLLCYAMYQLEEAGSGEKLAIQHDGSC